MTIYEKIVAAGGDKYLASDIVLWHTRPMQKLRGMLRLVREGHSVRVAQFSVDVLLIDGERAPWSALEAAASKRGRKR